MLTTAAFATLSTILILVSVIAMSYNDATVKNTCWTFGETDNGNKIWVGLNEFVVEIEGETKGIGWRSADCGLGGDDSYCDECKTVCLESISFAVMNLITSLPNIKGAIERSTKQGDRNCEKNFQLLTGIVSFASSLASLSVYADGCARNLPTELETGESLEYQYGPGFVCILVATLLLPFNIIANLFLPVPDVMNSGIRTNLIDAKSDKTIGDTKL